MATRPCPYCAEEIQAEAVICRFCQSTVTAASVDKSKPPVSAPPAGAFGQPWVKVVGAVVVLAVVVGGFFLVRSVVIGKVEVRGEVTLSDPDGYLDLGSSCSGKGGYDDITEGAGVTISDEDGKRVGLGRLDAGTEVGDSCVFTFSIDDLPSRDLYAVEVTHRGEVTFKKEDAMSVHLSLG